MFDQNQYFKSGAGGQFFKYLSEFEVKVISLYDFNPIIERRRISSTILQSLRCTPIPCSESEFLEAQNKAIELLDLSQSLNYCITQNNNGTQKSNS